jgi:hypothetical protein
VKYVSVQWVPRLTADGLDLAQLLWLISYIGDRSAETADTELSPTGRRVDRKHLTVTATTITGDEEPHRVGDYEVFFEWPVLRAA